MQPPTPPHHPLRVAVIGVGAFGRNHLRVLRALETENGSVQLMAAVDADPAARDRTSADYGIPAFPDIAALLAGNLRIDAASVCTPTTHHASAALALMTAGIDVLIEKPIAATLAEADTIITSALQHGRIVQIGHLERFNPAVTAALPLLNRPMFFESHRLSVFTPRSLDVDVVLDLMIHDLDIVLRLANSPVREVRAVGLPVLSRKTDIANIRVEFESGAVANFTASRISTEQVRKLRFFQPHQYLSLDFARQDLLLIDVTPTASLMSGQGMEDAQRIAAAAEILSSRSEAPHDPATQSLSSRSEAMQNRATQTLSSRSAAEGSASSAEPQKPPQSQHPTAGFSLRKIPTEPGEPLRLEIEDFLNAVRTRRPPEIPAEQGRAALALALEINATIAAHAQRTGLNKSDVPGTHSAEEGSSK